MSIVTTNKFKSTTIFGLLNVVNSVDGNTISNTNLTGNLTVGGKFNNIPVDTIAYIGNLTSDAQEQINTKANTTDVTTTNNNLSILQTLVDTKANTTDLTTTNNTVTTLQTLVDTKANSTDVTTTNNTYYITDIGRHEGKFH